MSDDLITVQQAVGTIGECLAHRLAKRHISRDQALRIMYLIGGEILANGLTTPHDRSSVPLTSLRLLLMRAETVVLAESVTVQS